MTPEEKTLLTDFLSRLTTAGAVQADAEAAMLIARAGEQQPGALYLTVQRAVWLEHALQQAQARIQSLEAAQGAAANPAGSGNPWLATTWGSGSDNGRTTLPPQHAMAAPQAAAGYPQATGYPSAYPNAGSGLPGAAGGFMSGPGFLGGGNSFLANVATTAAGVAVGSLIANALTSHHSGNQGFADLPPERTAAEPLASVDDPGALGDFDGGGSDSGGFDSDS
jgi:hypothetical protein